MWLRFSPTARNSKKKVQIPAVWMWCACIEYVLLMPLEWTFNPWPGGVVCGHYRSGEAMLQYGNQSQGTLLNTRPKRLRNPPLRRLWWERGRVFVNSGEMPARGPSVCDVPVTKDWPGFAWCVNHVNHEFIPGQHQSQNAGLPKNKRF